jgi:hypothetical protein
LPRTHGKRQIAEPRLEANKQPKELKMMQSAMNCGPNGWAMIAVMITAYGVLALGGAALIKYLFFSKRDPAAA